MNEKQKTQLSDCEVETYHRSLYNPSNETMIEILRGRISELETKHNELIKYLKEQNGTK